MSIVHIFHQTQKIEYDMYSKMNLQKNILLGAILESHPYFIEYLNIRLGVQITPENFHHKMILNI